MPSTLTGWTHYRWKLEGAPLSTKNVQVKSKGHQIQLQCQHPWTVQSVGKSTQRDIEHNIYHVAFSVRLDFVFPQDVGIV